MGNGKKIPLFMKIVSLDIYCAFPKEMELSYPPFIEDEAPLLFLMPVRIKDQGGFFPTLSPNDF